jgi:hypothetical protein
MLHVTIPWLIEYNDTLVYCYSITHLVRCIV